MTLVHYLLLIVVSVPLALVILGRLRIDLASLLIAITLGTLQALGLGVLGPAHAPEDAALALSGFSQPAVITLMSLFILTRCLDNTGITRLMAHQLLRLGGRSERRLIVLFASATAVLSLFMNNLAAGALVLPSALEACRRTKIRPSKLLIPVAYGSLLGGAATYFTTANIIVSNLLTTARPPLPPLHILDFTPTGGLIAVAGILFMGIWGSNLLPDRTPTVEQPLAPQSLHGIPELATLETEVGEKPFDLRGALLAGGVIVGAVILAVMGFPDYLAITGGALLVLLTGLITMEEAYRAIDWQAIFLVAGMYAVSRALVASGLADLVGNEVVRWVSPFGPLGLAAGAYLLTAGLTQIMGGQVATLVTGPVLIGAAVSLHVSPHAVAVAAAIGCSASFLTPIAHPVNILMIGPSGYRFSDFFRIGLPLTVISFVMLLIGLRVFWGL